MPSIFSIQAASIPNFNGRSDMRGLYTPSYLQFCHRLPLSSSSSATIRLHLPSALPNSLSSSIFHETLKNLSLINSGLSRRVTSMAAATTNSSSTEVKPFSVLFVCLGNICRSPAAEGVFRDIVKKRGLDSKFYIDSAGTINYHEGNPADSRMRAASKRRGIEITSISRPIRPSDFSDFDLILAMDLQNRDDILGAFERWSFKEPLPRDAHKKVKLMCSYCKKHNETEVPDPYYGGPQGFEKVLDLLEDACESLLESIISENSQTFIS